MTKYDTDYVDEVGIYLLYFLSKEKYTIQVQNWLDKEFFQLLHEQHRIDAGIDQDTLVLDVDFQRQVLRNMATADNVIKSGHFMKGKDIPELHISFLDLDGDNREFLVIDTIIPSSVVLDGSILDFIMEDQFADVDILEPGDLNTVMILNGTMSFHRSRRIEKKEQQGLIEFL